MGATQVNQGVHVNHWVKRDISTIPSLLSSTISKYIGKQNSYENASGFIKEISSKCGTSPLYFPQKNYVTVRIPRLLCLCILVRSHVRIRRCDLFMIYTTRSEGEPRNMQHSLLKDEATRASTDGQQQLLYFRALHLFELNHT